MFFNPRKTASRYNLAHAICTSRFTLVLLYAWRVVCLDGCSSASLDKSCRRSARLVALSATTTSRGIMICLHAAWYLCMASSQFTCMQTTSLAALQRLTQARSDACVPVLIEKLQRCDIFFSRTRFVLTYLTTYRIFYENTEL